MTSLLSDFLARKQQVRRYVAHILHEERSTGAGTTKSVAAERLSVLKAGSFLILYNLIEASARSGVEAIHDQMVTQKIPFQSLRPSLRREVVKGFKRRADPDVQKDMTDVPTELVAAALDIEHSFSGNVDAKLIREVAALYGFSVLTDKALTRDGADLVTIKSNRNDLAHGLKSYDEVGRSYTGRNILEIGLRATRYVETVVANIEDYLINKGYGNPPA